MAIQSIKKLEDYSPAPAGANQQIQYNNNGVLGASSNLTFDGTNLTVAGQGIGVGEAPPTWSSAFDFVQIGGTMALASQPNVQASQAAWITQNAHYDIDNSWEYQATDEANRIGMSSGNITFDNAPAGTAGNDITWSERMRIGADGKVMVGTTGLGSQKVQIYNTTNGTECLALVTNQASAYGMTIDFTAASPDNNANWFLRALDSTAIRCWIYSDGDVWTSDAGTLTSDERLKTNIVDTTPKLDDLMRLRVRNYEWTPDYHPNKVGEKKIGFIAQELEEVFPSLVGEADIALDNSIEEVLYVEGDEIPEGKNIGDIKIEAKPHEPVMRKTYKNAFTPILVKSIQELTIRVQELEARLEALGG